MWYIKYYIGNRVAEFEYETESIYLMYLLRLIHKGVHVVRHGKRN